MKITETIPYHKKNNLFDPLTAFPNPTDSQGRFKNKMTQAIKDFKDEYFTGLTDEEKEQIAKEIDAYIQSHLKNNKVDRSSLGNFVQHLLVKYGYKGNIFEATSGLVNLYTEEDGAVKEDEAAYHEPLASMRTPIQFSHAPQIGLSNLSSSTDHDSFDEKDPLVTKIIENADGSKTVLMMRHNQIVHQIRLSKVESQNRND